MHHFLGAKTYLMASCRLVSGSCMILRGCLNVLCRSTVSVPPIRRLRPPTLMYVGTVVSTLNDTLHVKSLFQLQTARGDPPCLCDARDICLMLKDTSWHLLAAVGSHGVLILHAKGACVSGHLIWTTSRAFTKRYQQQIAVWPYGVRTMSNQKIPWRKRIHAAEY
jgi:hypothetical protein